MLKYLPTSMASFDDLAFTGPPAADTVASTALELFCRDCNDVPQATTTDGKRCLVCGCELERRRQAARPGLAMPNAMFGGSETSVQELQTMVMRLLTQIGNDWNGGGDAGARRPA
ncbi:hypothetical protein DVH05_007762, partial [Phytophthora capsici]